MKNGISIDVEDADLDDLLRLFAHYGELNIVRSPCMASRTVTVALKEVPWDQALGVVLDALGLSVGPWIDQAKKLLRDGVPDAEVITIPGAGEIPFGVLRAQVFRTGPGQKFAYVTDVADTPENRTRIVDLATGADQLFIEAVFLDADQAFAEATRHLTARAAGEIARAADVRRVTPFHHSARYQDDVSVLSEEVSAAFNAA